MALRVKICGLNEVAALDAALDAGADMVGLVFFPKSPRNVDLESGARLATRACGRAEVVALTVDATDALLAAIVDAVRPDLLQLHGAETPERVAAIRHRFCIPVMKAIRVGTAADLSGVAEYRGVADRILFDAKAPETRATLPGGNGLAFDWRLLAGIDPASGFMLSGGLDAENVGQALDVTRARGVDVSSGVESAPGVKDPARIRAFMAAARSVPAAPSIERTFP